MDSFILIPDSFKGTMSSSEICALMEAAIRRHKPNATVRSIPVADGGEGSVDCFLQAVGGQRVQLRVAGPFFDEVDAFYGLLPDGRTAVVEMAACAGLPLAEGRLDPQAATTYGVGQLMLHAAEQGARRIILGLGGSATTDGGCGAAAALGLRFLDGEGRPFTPVGGTLGKIAAIDASTLAPAFSGVELTAMCDIDNPMAGPTGAAYVFGPQKGADPAMVQRLDAGLVHLAGVIEQSLGRQVAGLPGAGAAGAMGAGMVAFLGARLQMGIQTVLDTVGFDALLKEAGLVFTGEGKLDSQSLRGKVVIGVARRARAAGVPVVAVVGDIADDIGAAYDEGVSAVFSINRVAVPFEKARPRARSDLSLTMDDIMRLLALGG